MKTNEIILYGIFVLIIGFLIYSTVGILAKDNVTETAGENQQGVVQGQQYETIATGTTESGDVEIALTPQWREGKLYINLAANTHSVDLSQFNLQQQTTLKYNDKQLKPSQAPLLSGHHSNNIIIFDMPEQPKTFTIVMNGVPAVPERVYIW
jgi:hypothetical protein